MSSSIYNQISFISWQDLLMTASFSKLFLILLYTARASEDVGLCGKGLRMAWRPSPTALDGAWVRVTGDAEQCSALRARRRGICMARVDAWGFSRGGQR